MKLEMDVKGYVFLILMFVKICIGQSTHKNILRGLPNERMSPSYEQSPEYGYYTDTDFEAEKSNPCGKMDGGSSSTDVITSIGGNDMDDDYDNGAGYDRSCGYGTAGNCDRNDNGDGMPGAIGAEYKCNNNKCNGIYKHTFPKSSLSQKASNIAMKAAQDAQAANNAQMEVASAAARKIKLELAERALKAAQTAEAALVGKQQVLEHLQNERCEAEAIVTEVSDSLKNTEAYVAMARETALQAQSLLNQLIKLSEASKKTLAMVESVACGTEEELAEKMKLLEAARWHEEKLVKQLQMARRDYDITKEAADKAACAAMEAKRKAGIPSEIPQNYGQLPEHGYW